ncbi:hypothetical protein CDAR_313431 [Caerostris darwini]|uniref:LAGLIDADG homing endonuclease n=1 Tax=Caerostris darwini TaxID=1538125 RepID=A0AAV4N2V9_9ARAC|nr:hypothetical protein CDAR_313431 [Caerostris darwini]
MLESQVWHFVNGIESNGSVVTNTAIFDISCNQYYKYQENTHSGYEITPLKILQNFLDKLAVCNCVDISVQVKWRIGLASELQIFFRDRKTFLNWIFVYALQSIGKG